MPTDDYANRKTISEESWADLRSMEYGEQIDELEWQIKLQSRFLESKGMLERHKRPIKEIISIARALLKERDELLLDNQKLADGAPWCSNDIMRRRALVAEAKLAELTNAD